MNSNNKPEKTAPGAVFVGMEDIAAIIVERIADGQSAELSPRGRSMLPLIREGKDSVILSPKPEKLKKYDIPLYTRADGKYVLHRVVSVRNGAYVMCGDNQFTLEQGITHERVIAVVSAIRRGGKLFSVNHPIYRAYAVIWCVSRPARYFAFRVFRKIKRIMKK